MALYNFLPVYKTSYDLLIEIFSLVKNFSRDYRYTIGERLKNEIIKLVINIFRANSRYDKLEILQQARENIETARLLMRLLKDLKQVGLERFLSLNEKVESISKQLAAWQGKARVVGATINAGERA